MEIIDNDLKPEKVTSVKYSPSADPTSKIADANDLNFELGLVMAGAVSAGSYTAGVVDFLMEALDAWEKVKEKERDLPVEERTVPFHNVRIKVVAGASAGGMTAAIMAAQIRNEAVGVPTEVKPLKQVWVEEIDMKNLLEDSDLQNDQQDIYSILDSTKITKIADDAFNFQPAKRKWEQPKYIHNKLKLILSLSNLRGVPYEFNIAGETGFKYGMLKFADYEKIAINKDTKKGEWERLKDAALATGAFPVGLSARLVHRDPKEYIKRSKENNKDFISVKFDDQNTYTFTCVDGGVFNNEPLELAREELYKCADQFPLEKAMLKRFNDDQICKDTEFNNYLSTLDRSLILIDPFPNVIEVSNVNDDEHSLKLTEVIPRLIGALRRQALFKPDELLVAAHKENYSNFMISPIRYTKTELKARYPIASGFLGGFGGFFIKGFREHDYELGRRNCQRFLQRYFVVPAKEFSTNKIFNGTNGNLLAKYQVSDIIEDCKQNQELFYYPIIPLMGEDSDSSHYEHVMHDGSTLEIDNMQLQVDQPEWPGYQTEEFTKLIRKVAFRIKLLFSRLLPRNFFGWLVKSSLTIAVLCVLITGMLFVTESYNYIPSHFFLPYLRSLLLLLAGVMFTVSAVFYFLRSFALRRIKALLMKELKEYAFFD